MYIDPVTGSRIHPYDIDPVIIIIYVTTGYVRIIIYVTIVMSVKDEVRDKMEVRGSVRDGGKRKCELILNPFTRGVRNAVLIAGDICDHNHHIHPLM